jgi:membrane protein YdbS with pleckstrin-like domain
VSDGQERKPDPRDIPASRLSGAVTVSVLGAASLVGLLIALLAGRPTRLWAGALALGWLVLNGGLATLALTWPALRYRHTSYRVDGRGIRIRRGVVWRSEITVPRSRVQHTDVSRGPIERSFGLATLIIHTAGTEHASVSLGGLSAPVATAIRNFLIEGGEDDAV